jgi:hypothetical protein
MASSYVDRSQSNIYLDDPDFYQQNHHHVHHLSPQHSVSTMNMSSMVAASSFAPSSSSTLKNATSMQQLKDSTMKTKTRSQTTSEQENMVMDQGQSALSIPDIYEQQLMNERLMCIQQMMASGQNLASMFNDDPHFVQQIMGYMPPGNYYRQEEEEEEEEEEEPDVIEIMDE